MEELSLFLSPHLDDAVLSCAGQILTDSQAGRRVLVATIFSTGDATEPTRKCYERRRAEDSQALQILGAEPVWLGLPDAPFRRDFYRNFHEIVFDTHPDDVGYVAQVTKILARLVDDTRPTRVYAPLAVGTHIDHRLTHDAVRTLTATPDVTYYEDRPYALIPFAVPMRLAQLGAVSDCPDGGPETDDVLETTFLQGFEDAYWTHTYLPAGPQRERCKARLVADLLQGRTNSGIVVRAETRTYSDAVFSRVFEAVTAYSSQFVDLFADRDDYVAQTRSYNIRLAIGSRYSERYWSITRKPHPGIDRL